MKISGEIHVFHRDYQAAVYGISTLEVYEWALNYLVLWTVDKGTGNDHRYRRTELHEFPGR